MSSSARRGSGSRVRAAVLWVTRSAPLALLLYAGGVGAGSETYEYDELGRLRSVAYGDRSTLYTLDAAGNRTNVATVGSPGSFVLVSPPSSVAENAGSLTFTVGRVNGSTGAVSVRCQTNDASALAGQDFTALNATLNWADADAANKTCTVTLTDDTVHEGNETFTLQLTNASGASIGSPSSQIVTIIENDPVPDTTPPTVPQQLSATPANSSRVDLSWVASTDPGGAAAPTYRIERCTGGGCGSFAEIGSSSAASYADATTVGTTSYSYRVRARDAANNYSGYSNVVTVATPDTIAPNPPANFTATAVSASQIDLSWTAAVDLGGSGISRYRLHKDGGWYGDPTGTTASITFLAASTTYSFTLVAIDNAGNVSSSVGTSATTHPPPPQPPGPTSWTNGWGACSSTCITMGSEVLTWAVSGGGAPSHYEVWYSDNFGSTWVRDAMPTSPSVLVAVPWGATRQFRARTCNATGCGAYTTVISFYYDPNP